MSADPLLVAFYAGPGVGKSTAAMRVAAELKMRGVNAEYVSEYAKDLTWERRQSTLGYQPYIAAKQMWAIDRLRGQVDVVVTDSSPLLGLVYDPGATQAFSDWLTDDYSRRRTLNIVLRRGNRGYETAGRSQTLDEAKALDDAIADLLNCRGLHTVALDPRAREFVTIVCDIVRDRENGRRAVDDYLDKRAAKE